MKQNKQSICLAAPPLRQCVFLGYLLFSCCLLARQERMGQTMTFPVTGERRSCCNPASMPANRRPFCRERPGIVGCRN